MLPEIDIKSISILTSGQAWKYKVIPASHDMLNNKIHLLCAEELNDSQIQELELLTGYEVEFNIIGFHDLHLLLETYYRRVNLLNKLNVSNDDFLEVLINDAFQIKASDIHIEVYNESSRIRMRVDGKLIDRFNFNSNDSNFLINKLKIKANLDIAEKRLPQDGRITYKSLNNEFDIRVSIIPTIYGEKAVLRLLNNSSVELNFQSLGMTPEQLNQYLEALKRSNGIILINGPTGSGKTSTLYATLKTLNSGEQNILTIEDPVEYTLDGINQVQVKESIGLTFASTLRTFLRQDPDIIMIGEIRDNETAEMAIRAALTGHLVLSTIHTNSAIGAITRLNDMGLPLFLLAETINVSIAQRLVRKLCNKCKKEAIYNPKYIPPNFKMPFLIDKHFMPFGCPECYFTGYHGRKGVFELLIFNDIVIKFIKSNREDITSVMNNENQVSLTDQCLEMVACGETSFEEIYPILLNNYN